MTEDKSQTPQQYPAVAPPKPPTPTPQAGGTTAAKTPASANTQPQPAQQPEPVPTNAAGQKLVSNVFAGTDIKEAFSEIASSAGVTVIPDESIKTTLVYMEFRNEPVESAILKLAMLSGAYVKEKSPGVFLVSQATPESGLFREFSETKLYLPKNQSAATLQSLLPQSYRSYVQVDVKTNHISISAPSQLLDRIYADLDKMDSPSRQFVVEALVTEMDGTNAANTGFSWSWKNFAVGSDLSLQYTQAAQSDIATVKALITSGKATLRANPRVNAFEGQEANLTIGQETYFSILTGNVNFPTAQIQLIKTGVTLNFTGYIGDDGTITLNLAPEVSDAIVSVNGNPTTNVRRVSTMVRVKPGETIAIGGLVQESTSYSKSRIPLLGDLPVIGELFTQRNNSTVKKEVLILITPYLTDTGAAPKGIDSNRKLPGVWDGP
jgi:type II secretory pathway component GspD/PulD (secretin)